MVEGRGIWRDSKKSNYINIYKGRAIVENRFRELPGRRCDKSINLDYYQRYILQELTRILCHLRDTTCRELIIANQETTNGKDILQTKSSLITFAKGKHPEIAILINTYTR